ncbi:signal peptide-containing protein [Theileria equi strain WA]|uniref:Signal peptide-containing protein n=1 Tax=Theileria equi strain WA TaxID=1537102 RepID=L0B0H9_THEEQ|nr:signal peptide-containing protein [Theileria equi strain WA]AFZ81320.1 signal peptide-containing protein [Theileria equi strain WA]|eukprot:XP_004830986.1 signal peptide-containing protein [Theileria equi strain WA]
MKIAKRSFLLFIYTIVCVLPTSQAALFGCSSDKRRCLNSCDERHRTSVFSFASRSACKARCILTECVLYPNSEKKSEHPADRLRGFSS